MRVSNVWFYLQIRLPTPAEWLGKSVLNKLFGAASPLQPHLSPRWWARNYGSPEDKQGKLRDSAPKNLSPRSAVLLVAVPPDVISEVA